jgi:dienelactone hydrolase
VTTYTASFSVPGGLSGRTVNLKAFLPVGVTNAPVVVVHPGFMLDGTLYASYAQHLASRGTVTVVVDPPFALVFGPNQAELAQYLGKVVDWVGTESADGGMAGVADSSKLILAGHSVGGKVSLLLATTDHRPLGVFAIDPVDAAGGPGTSPSPSNPSVTPELMNLITVPLATIGETTNATCTGTLCQACAPAADNFHQYALHATSKTVEIEMVGANHMSFLDNPNCATYCSQCPVGTDNPTQTRRLTRRYLTAFTDLVARNDVGAREWLAGAPMQADVLDGGVKEQTLNGF